MKMQSDGIPYNILSKIEQSFGNTVIRIIPNECNVYDIDSAFAIKRYEYSVVNMNDNSFNIDQISHIKSFCGNPTIALLGYTGAGPYPQTYFLEKDVLNKKAQEKKEEFFNRYRQMRDALQPKVTIPFAGKYVLGGFLHKLNDYRGVADAVEVLAFDPNAIVLADGGKWSIDTETLQPTQVRTTPYNHKDVTAYTASLAEKPMIYETYFRDLPIQAIPFQRLLPKAYKNALIHSYCQIDYYFCIHLRDGYFVGNAKSGSEEYMFVKSVDHLKPRSVIYIDFRYLYGLITCIFHRNNAEI